MTTMLKTTDPRVVRIFRTLSKRNVKRLVKESLMSRGFLRTLGRSIKYLYWIVEESRPMRSPFVPSPDFVVERMLSLAEVRPTDTVYDLGCGDGRILIAAAQKFHANAVGVELDEQLCERTLKRIREMRLEGKVKIIHGDFLQVDLAPATVVTLYLLTGTNEEVRPHLEKYLKGGTRIISHRFVIPGWEPDRVEELVDPHKLYLYRR